MLNLYVVKIGSYFNPFLLFYLFVGLWDVLFLTEGKEVRRDTPSCVIDLLKVSVDPRTTSSTTCFLSTQSTLQSILLNIQKKSRLQNLV